jgi:hypothetical protein
MVCTFCGAPSSERAMVCAACLERVHGELYLREWTVDPRSDQRSLGSRSACLRVGPSSQGEVLLGKGSDPYLLVERTLQAEDRSHLPTVLDQYLGGMGVGLHLMGDEKLPPRPILKKLVSIPEGMEYEGDRWGRALLRIGNLLAISARDVSRLPLGDEGRKEAFRERASKAMDLYQRAGKVPELGAISRANLAMLRHWSGEHEAAIEEMRAVGTSSDEARMQLAKVLWDMGREDEAADVVSQTTDIEGSIVRLRGGCQ